MNNELKAVWERYVATWKVTSPAEKRQIYATCLAPACVYTDPLTQARGWDELDRYMESFHEQVPGGHFVTEQFFAHHGRSVARWRMLSGEGLPLGEGISYAEYDEQQRLVAMTGFFETPRESWAGVSYYLERIQCGVDYIETKLDEDVALSDVAKTAGISQWHFQRIFKALTGETLKTYIRSRRLAASLDRLLSTDLRVLDIALLAGFESQEAFARAFKQAFGLTPQKYRALRDKSLFLKKPRFDEQYLQQLTRNDAPTPEIYEQPPLLLVGLRTLFYSVDSEKNNIGELLPPLWGAFIGRLSEIENKVAGVCYGVVRQERADSDRLEYHAAIAVSELAALPAGMVSVEVPAGTYARFEHRGPAPRVDHTVSYAYATWLAQSDYRHSYAADLEIYGAAYHPTNDDSVFHYAIPIARS